MNLIRVALNLLLPKTRKKLEFYKKGAVGTKWVISDLKRSNLIIHFRKYKLSKEKYWYLAPATEKWEGSQHKIHPLRLAFLLSNAKLNFGVAARMSDLLPEREELTTTKTDFPKLAEELLERVRKEYYPKKPSRLACHFLNSTREVALKRQTSFGESFKNRRLEECFLIEDQLRLHMADIRIYEELAENPCNEKLARKYWQDFKPQSLEEEHYLEILVDGCLFFPNWQDFPLLQLHNLGQFNQFIKEKKAGASPKQNNET